MGSSLRLTLSQKGRAKSETDRGCCRLAGLLKEFLRRFARDRRRWLIWLFEAKKRYGTLMLNQASSQITSIFLCQTTVVTRYCPGQCSWWLDERDRDTIRGRIERWLSGKTGITPLHPSEILRLWSSYGCPGDI
jgi:hypothetical protein